MSAAPPSFNSPSLARAPIAEASRRAKFALWFLAAGVVILPGLAFLGPLAIAVLGTIMALVSGLLVDAKYRPDWKDPLVAIGALGLVGAISALGAVDPGHAVAEAARFLLEILGAMALFAAAARLDAISRRRLLDALVVGMVLALTIAVIEIATDAALLRQISDKVIGLASLDRGASALALALWPMAAHLHRRARPGAAIALALAAALVIVLLDHTSSKIALIVAVIVAVLAYRDDIASRLARFVPVALAVVLLAAPLLAHALPPARDIPAATEAKPSALHRLVIWRFTAERIADRPLRGWGMDNARVVPGGSSAVPLQLGQNQTLQVQRLPLHPHNAALQIWLELGLIGAALMALASARVARQAIHVPDPVARASAAATFATALTILMLGYGAWQSWWVWTLILVAWLVRLGTGGAGSVRA